MWVHRLPTSRVRNFHMAINTMNVVTNSLLVQQQWYVLNKEGVEGTDRSEGGTRDTSCSTPRRGEEEL
jgi:hypothetical protein